MPDLERGNVEGEVAQLHSSNKDRQDPEEGSATLAPEMMEKSRSIKSGNLGVRFKNGLSYDDIFKKLSEVRSHRHTDPETSSGTDTVDTMHLRNLWHLRSKISKHILISSAAQEGIFGGSFKQVIDPEEIRRDLKHYSTALRDWEYWKENKKFMTASLTRMRSLTTHLAAIDFAKHIAQSEYCDENDLLFQAQQKMREHIKHHFLADEARARHESVFTAAAVKRRSDFQIRILIAVSAGLALIAPMLIMSLHQSKLTSLVTTSVFVVAVAVILAWVMEDAQNKDIVAATAAYAAVLVVFVGTGSGGG